MPDMMYAIETDSIIKPIGKLALLIDGMSMEEYVFFMLALSKDMNDRSEDENKFLNVVARLTQE